MIGKCSSVKSFSHRLPPQDSRERELLYLSFCFGSVDLKRAISTQLMLRVKGRHLALNSFPGFSWAPAPRLFFFFAGRL